MKDKTMILIVGMVLVSSFSSLAVMMGYDGIVIGSTLFILGSAMGVVMPRPGFIRGG